MHPEKLIEHIAKSYCLPVEALMTRSKVRHITEPRQLAIYVLRKKLKLKPREVAKLMNTTGYIVFKNVQYVEKKMEDPDFKQHFDELMASYGKEEDNSVEMSLKRDLDYFLSLCDKVGDCYVKENFVATASLGRKYNVTTATQLYYILSTGKYPNSDVWNRIQRTCNTVNCVVHTECEELGDVVDINTELDERAYCSPEERMFYAIFRSAIEENDVDYFKSGVFLKHLRELNVEKPHKILQYLKERSIL